MRGEENKEKGNMTTNSQHLVLDGVDLDTNLPSMKKMAIQEVYAKCVDSQAGCTETRRKLERLHPEGNFCE